MIAPSRIFLVSVLCKSATTFYLVASMLESEEASSVGFSAGAFVFSRLARALLNPPSLALAPKILNLRVIGTMEFLFLRFEASFSLTSLFKS